ncbi:mitochondrial amidoxime reducing component 2 isoform X2 [Vulpes vulpes]|uniref:Mitochondrial amidoxime reducing component 2 n=1 Tax=Vulpes vulpes TaxID=9627 RepID=A0ABM5ALK5_VULVU
MGAASSWAPRRLGLPAPSRPAWLAGAALGLAAAALGTVAWRRARSRRRGRLQQVGTVAQLWIYPVKSCKGVRVSAAECTALGLRCGHLRDRFWLVIKEDGHMVTARQEPRLVLVSITCEGECLMLKAPGMDQLVLPSKLPPSNKVHDCRLFGMDIKGRDCGDEAAQWFTSFLKTEAFRLVQFEKHMKGRPSKEIFSPVVPNYQVAYPDCSPIMILSEASLADLNTRLEKKVKMDQFRPNIVVTGCDAFEEQVEVCNTIEMTVQRFPISSGVRSPPSSAHCSPEWYVPKGEPMLTRHDHPQSVVYLKVCCVVHSVGWGRCLRTHPTL